MGPNSDALSCQHHPQLESQVQPRPTTDDVPEHGGNNRPSGTTYNFKRKDRAVPHQNICENWELSPLDAVWRWDTANDRRAAVVCMVRLSNQAHEFFWRDISRKDATLREVLAILRNTAFHIAEYRHPLARFSFCTVYADSTNKSRFLQKELGMVYSRDILGEPGSLNDSPPPRGGGGWGHRGGRGGRGERGSRSRSRSPRGRDDWFCFFFCYCLTFCLVFSVDLELYKIALVVLCCWSCLRRLAI